MTFVGRSEDLRTLVELSRTHLLVTIWGPAGIGKTRLATELLRREPGIFVDLSHVRSVDEILMEVANELGADISSLERDRAVDRIRKQLENRGPGYLVLDNFEQVAELAPVLRPWLGAGGTRIIVTSRERLRLAQEVCLELQPLEVEAATQLFGSRVRLVRRDFALTERNAEQIRAITQNLDCIPLAIELAAARADVLGIPDLEKRIASSLEILTRGMRDAPSRHATLDEAIRWSWDQLNPLEKRALAQCSVFRGGFTLEAAESILDGEEIVDLLSSLRDKSLIRTTTSYGETVRFNMLECIRQFGERRLDPADAVRRRHVAYYTSAAAEWSRRSDQRRLEVELANVTIALESALDGADQANGLDAVLALDAVYSTRGPCTRHLALLDRALDCAVGLLRIQILRARARVWRRLGHLDRAERDLSDALDDARRARSSLDEGTLLCDLGVLRHQERRMEEAEKLYRRALSMHRNKGRRAEEARALGNLGGLAHDRCAYDEAKRSYTDALKIYREVGDRRLEGLYVATIGILDHERGRLQSAADYFARGIEALEAAGDDRLLAITLGNRGALDVELGALEEALAAYRRALELLAEVGDQRSRGLGHLRMSAAFALMGREGEAQREIGRARDVLSDPLDTLGVEVADLAEAFLDVSAARRAWLEDAAEAAGERLRRVRHRIDASRRSHAQSALLDRSDDARVMVRILTSAIESFAPAPGVLAIGPGAKWLRPSGGEWIDLRRRHPLRRVLRSLVGTRLFSMRPLDLEALREAAWPGEKIKPEAASNRVYVALTTLRKLGIADSLQSTDAGYRLDPDVPIGLVHPPVGERSPRAKPDPSTGRSDNDEERRKGFGPHRG